MKLKKSDIAGLIQQIDEWHHSQNEKLASAKPMFRRWVENQISELKSEIENQEFEFAIQSRMLHLASQWRRMQTGEIESVSKCGESFTIKTTKFGKV